MYLSDAIRSTDITAQADDELNEAISILREEKDRRKKEPRHPVFIVDGCANKNLTTALIDLKDDIDVVLSFKGGPEGYFKERIDYGQSVVLMSLRVEFWNDSDYKTRPDKVYGY